MPRGWHPWCGEKHSCILWDAILYRLTFHKCVINIPYYQLRRNIQKENLLKKLNEPFPSNTDVGSGRWGNASISVRIQKLKECGAVNNEISLRQLSWHQETWNSRRKYGFVKPVR